MNSLLNAPPSLGCVLSLTGQPGGGARLHDLSPYGNSGLIAGATWEKPEGGLWSLSFDGIDDRVDCGNGGALKLTGADTVMLWVKPANGSDAHVISKDGGSGDRGWYICLLANLKIRAAVAASATSLSYFDTDAALPAGRWHHIARTYDGKSINVYLDGVKQSGVQNGGVPPAQRDASASLTIGRRPGGDLPYSGRLALAGIYNRPLTALEIQRHFDAEKHIFGVW